MDSIRLWPGIFLVIVWVSGCDFRVPFLIGEPEEAVISYEETEVGGPPCSTQSDCEEGNACVQFPSTTVCRLICEDYDELCGEKTSCKEVGAGGLGANVCQAFSLGGDIIPEEAPTLLQDG